jgi:Na+:H+ antiporter, NhaA family
MYRVSPFVTRCALALLGGALVATIWVTLAPSSYYDAVEWRFLDLHLPSWLTLTPISLTARTLVADGVMALFYGLIGKELWEALVLDRGALRGQKAVLPLGLTLGGMIGAAGLWIAVAALIETAEEAGPLTGWQVPLGSDVVLTYLMGRMVFGRQHPALHLLLLVTMVGDILALVLMGLTQTAPVFRPAWLALPIMAALALWAGTGRINRPASSERARRAQFRVWPAILAGCLSWVGTAAAGLPPALGLLPVIPAIARADRSFGLFAEVEELLHDPLNRLAHALTWPVVLGLFLFGLTHGGADLSAFAPTTVVTLAAVWLGRPLGMCIIGLGLAAGLGLRLPPGLALRDILLVGLLSGMAFTLPVLTLDMTLPGGAMQEAARLGLAISLLAGPFALLIGRTGAPRGGRPAGPEKAIPRPSQS